MIRLMGVLLAGVVMLGVVAIPVIAGTEGPLRVFATTATTNGAPENARAGMGAICKAEDTTAHFCSLQEIANALQTSGVEFQSPFPRAWVDNVGDGLTEADWWSGDNCSGWTASLTTGQVIDQNASNSTTGNSCSNVRPVACCSFTTASSPSAISVDGIGARIASFGAANLGSMIAAVLTVLALSAASWWRKR
jgi:hypothetical protein